MEKHGKTSDPRERYNLEHQMGSWDCAYANIQERTVSLSEFCFPAEVSKQVIKLVKYMNAYLLWGKYVDVDNDGHKIEPTTILDEFLNSGELNSTKEEMKKLLNLSCADIQRA